MAAMTRLNSSVAVMPCRNTERALCQSPAPMQCATCTEKPMAAAEHSPPNSHVLVDIRPMDADAFAPRLPTIEASMYCMAMDDSCVIMAGMLSSTVRWICSLRVSGLPSRMRASRRSVVPVLFICAMSVYLPAKVLRFSSGCFINPNLFP